MADVIDLIKYAGENKPVDFTNSFEELMGQKILSVLDAAKQSVASGIFNGTTEQSVEVEDEAETNIDNGDSYADS
jgi:hypothetical protein